MSINSLVIEEITVVTRVKDTGQQFEYVYPVDGVGDVLAAVNEHVSDIGMALTEIILVKVSRYAEEK